MQVHLDNGETAKFTEASLWKPLGEWNGCVINSQIVLPITTITWTQNYFFHLNIICFYVRYTLTYIVDTLLWLGFLMLSNYKPYKTYCNVLKINLNNTYILFVAFSHTINIQTYNNYILRFLKFKCFVSIILEGTFFCYKLLNLKDNIHIILVLSFNFFTIFQFQGCWIQNNQITSKLGAQEL